MDNRTIPAARPVPRRVDPRLFRIGLWLRFGIAGAWVALAGLAMLFDPGQDFSALGSLATIVGGGALAAVSWRRFATFCESADPEPNAAAPVKAGAQAHNEIRSAPALRLGVLTSMRH